MTEETKSLFEEKDGFARIRDSFLNVGDEADMQKLEATVLEASERKLAIFENVDGVEDGRIAVLGVMVRNLTRGQPKILKQVIFAKVPEFDDFEATEPGRRWIREIVDNALAGALRDRLKVDGITGSELPSTVRDFTVSSRALDLTGWKEFGKQALAALKRRNQTRNMQSMTLAGFKDLLESQAIAESLFPNVEASVWERVLDRIGELCVKNGLDAEFAMRWKETRNRAAEIDDTSEIDLSGF